MGYSTDFDGQFALDRPLAPEHAKYLRAFADSRRMDRDGAKTPTDPVRDAAGLAALPEYFVGDSEDSSVTDYNAPPRGQPGLWCDWAPTEDDSGIEWNGTEKFYDYVPWLEYLVAHFLAPWGYRLNGEVKWQGEDPEDFGLIVAKENVVTTRGGKRSYV